MFAITKWEDFPYGIDKSAVDDLIRKTYEDRPSMLRNFSEIFFANPEKLSTVNNSGFADKRKPKKETYFLIRDSCFWCASSITLSSLLLLSTSDPSLTMDEAISKCPLCESNKISTFLLFPRGPQFEYI
jgi:hypothetical protein